jgi:hypothetical protein
MYMRELPSLAAMHSARALATSYSLLRMLFRPPH